MVRVLMIIDLQNGIEDGANTLFKKKEVIDNVNSRINYFREKNWPIIFIQHEDNHLIPNTNKWHIFDGIDCLESDIYVGKTHANSFYHTNLEILLNQLSITEIEFCGAQTEYCVDTTLRMAHGLGYQCFMSEGATTTIDSNLLDASTIIKHHEEIWKNRFLTFI